MTRWTLHWLPDDGGFVLVMAVRESRRGGLVRLQRWGWGWARVDAADPVACAAHRERWMACDREAAAAFRAAHPWREA